MELSDYLLLGIFGSLGAFISGLLGVGGGIIYVPVLDYFLTKYGMKSDMLVKGILANSLFTIIFAGCVSSYKQYHMGNFFPKQIFQTAIPGMVSAVFFTWLIKTGTWYSKTTFNYVFASLLFVIFLRMFFSKKRISEHPVAEVSGWKYGLTGLFTGVISAFSGLGGGVVMTPIVSDVLKQSIKKASSVSNGVIPLLAIMVGIYNLNDAPAYKISEWQVGYIVFPIIIPMILASFIFAPMGVKASQRTSQPAIRAIFASFVGLVLIKIIYEIFTK